MDKPNDCPDCGDERGAEYHHQLGDGFCVCGACLYKHSEQVPDDMYPLFKCKVCGHITFWD